MSQKKRKSSVYSLNFLNSINAITLIFLISHGATVAVNQTTSATAQPNHTSIIYETGFVPIVHQSTEQENETNLFDNGAFKVFQDTDDMPKLPVVTANTVPEDKQRSRKPDRIHTLNSKELQDLILRYVDETLGQRTYEIISGIKIEEGNRTKPGIAIAGAGSRRSVDAASVDINSFDEQIIDRLTQFAETHVVNLNIPRAMHATGRLFFFKGNCCEDERGGGGGN